MLSRTLSIRFYLLLLVGLVVANVSIYRMIFAPHELEVNILKVGESLPAGKQGDAILVRTPSRATILVDAGPDASILRALGTALPEWQKKIDGIILSGEKSGATGGLPDVISHYRVLTVMHAGTDIPYGEAFALDGGISLTIIAPGTLDISYGTHSFHISSTTPPGAYVLNSEN